MLGEAGLVALDAPPVKALQTLDQYRGAIEAESGISAGGIGDVLPQEWVVNADFPAGRERLAEISDDELVEQVAESVDVGGGGGRLSGKDFGGEVGKRAGQGGVGSRGLGEPEVGDAEGVET